MSPALSFGSQTTFTVGTHPHAVAAVDLNGDGKLDLVTADTHANSISVLLGNGDGTFQTQIATPAGNKPAFAAIGDFNKDGHLDLAVSGAGQQVVRPPWRTLRNKEGRLAWITATRGDPHAALGVEAS